MEFYFSDTKNPLHTDGMYITMWNSKQMKELHWLLLEKVFSRCRTIFRSGLSRNTSVFIISPLLFILFAPTENQAAILDQIQSMALPRHVEVIMGFYTLKSVYRSHFPINLLRNIGLLHSTTSQVLILDPSKQIHGFIWILFWSRISSFWNQISSHHRHIYLVNSHGFHNRFHSQDQEWCSSMYSIQTVFLLKATGEDLRRFVLRLQLRIMFLPTGWKPSNLRSMCLV